MIPRVVRPPPRPVRPRPTSRDITTYLLNAASHVPQAGEALNLWMFDHFAAIERVVSNNLATARLDTVSTLS